MIKGKLGITVYQLRGTPCNDLRYVIEPPVKGLVEILFNKSRRLI